MVSRRALLELIGAAAGGTALYHAMSSLGFAAESSFTGPIKLEGDPKNASVVIIGAGLAGMVAALELRKAGYKVKVLEYNARAGGRSWTIRGGDRYTELGGFTQTCGFDPGLYFNPGPWRIPYHHRALLAYCKQLGIALEPFVQQNSNAYWHSAQAFEGKPQRQRHIQCDYQGHVAELLAKSTNQKALDDVLTREDAEALLESLKVWGAVDKDYRYTVGDLSSGRRGWATGPGGGLGPVASPSQPIQLKDLLRSNLWQQLWQTSFFDYQPTLFQPVGGMDMIAKAFARETKDLIRFNSRVTSIKQDDHGVTVNFEDTTRPDTQIQQVKADYCLCTMPLSVLSQIELQVGPNMQSAISSVSYAASVKIGLQFKRRFWEEDEDIYGGITATDLPIGQIAYPSSGFGTRGKGVLLGAYLYGTNAYEFTAHTPAERIAEAVHQGAQIHPQYQAEFENGMAVGWHRVPWTLGCFALWSLEGRAQHYRNLCEIDGRIALAGEHASHLPGWQEGALQSSLDAISRLHQRVLSR